MFTNNHQICSILYNKMFVIHNSITKSKNLMEIEVKFTALWRKREKGREM